MLLGSVAEAARFGDAVVLAVKGTGAAASLELAGAENLAGKLILDATNPIAEVPPEGGVLRFFTNLDQSLMERLQKQVPDARFVKAWSQVGNALMIFPQLPGGPPTMFICGDHAEARREAARILAEFGWESEDMGGAVAARAAVSVFSSCSGSLRSRKPEREKRASRGRGGTRRCGSQSRGGASSSSPATIRSRPLLLAR